MSTTTLNPPALERHVVLDGVSWASYQSLLRDYEERPMRMTYDEGRLEIMPPLPNHEFWKWRIGRMVDLMSFERKIEVEGLGSTTFSREDLAKGLEPDECYYIEHVDAIRGKDRLDLAVAPPPDLAIEVVITSRSIPRQPIYAALGVPELWRFDGKKLTVFRLGRDKKYVAASGSSIFPFLPIEHFVTFLLRMGHERQLAVLEEFREWVKAL